MVEIPVRTSRNGVVAPESEDHDDPSSGHTEEDEDEAAEDPGIEGHDEDDDEEQDVRDEEQDVRDEEHVLPLIINDYLGNGFEDHLEQDDDDNSNDHNEAEEQDGPRVKEEEEDGVEDGHGVGYEVVDEETLVRRAVVRRRVLGDGGE
jgi:hypothetical protein